jgi:hypothetical protein
VYSARIRLFGENGFHKWEQGWSQALKDKIQKEPRDYILNVNEAEYVEHLTDTYSVEPVELDLSAAEATDAERTLSEAVWLAGHRPSSTGRTMPVYTFHIPFTGLAELLRCKPTTGYLNTLEVQVDELLRRIAFDVVSVGNGAGFVNSQYLETAKFIREQSASLRADTERYNAAVPARARELFSARKAELMRQADVASRLVVPLRRNAAPATFAVPVRSPKRIVPRPQASASGPQAIHPTLDTSTYSGILQLFHDFGKQMERHPATYRGRDEQTLRDFFLLMLQPHFGIEGSATGETFNASGKTDILLRYENRNLFVAEFKFWQGAKVHLETIDQLLSYLTWRDSKAAIVYFVRGREMAAPLRAIEEGTPRHTAFVGLAARKEGSWFSYEFHLPGDAEQAVKVAVLCFHLPE